MRMMIESDQKRNLTLVFVQQSSLGSQSIEPVESVRITYIYC